MRLFHYRPSKQATFGLLMALSMLALLLPPEFTDGSKHGTQLLVPIQHIAYALTFKSAESLKQARSERDGDAAQMAALQNTIASQANLIEQLREDNLRMGAIQSRARTPALQAQIVARDLVAWRDTVLVERGSKGRINRRDWVASRFFIDQGDLADVREGSAVISREVLLGRVEQVSPYMSRVQLFSDVDSRPLEVRVGNLGSGGFSAVDLKCNLFGLGEGRMMIREIDYRAVQLPHEAPPADGAPRISIGAYVCSAPGTLGLPEPMVVGKVTAIEDVPDKRLHYNIIVEPAIGISDVRYVHVIPLLPTHISL